MTSPLQLLVALAAFTMFASAHGSAAERRQSSNVALCANPPVVRRVDLSAYAGQWFSIFNSGDATRVSGNQCTTANYTLRADGKVNVLNCQNFVPGETPSCVRGVAQRQVEFNRTSRLEVKFPFFPGGAYEIAALLGQRNYGYYAAAIFTCNAIGTGAKVPSFFIIARTPFAPRFTLHRLVRRLRRKGYALAESDFMETTHPPTCKYQKGPGSFIVPTAGPPPGVTGGAGPPPSVTGGAGPPPGVEGAGPPPGIPRM